MTVVFFINIISHQSVRIVFGRIEGSLWFCICSTRLKDGFPIQNSANGLIGIVPLA
jgi:hypothetical protein